jgi:hypothetical protein
MRSIPKALLFAVAFFRFVTSSPAQYGPSGGPYQPDSVSSLVEKVHADLNRGYDQWHLSKGDRERLNKAEKQLREFASDWHRGKFDKGNLDDAIAAVQHVLDNNHLSGEARDALGQDVEQLRNMREAYNRHEIGRW